VFELRAYAAAFTSQADLHLDGFFGAQAQRHVPDRRPERDALIAATALVCRLKLVTRNVAESEPMGVDLINSWERGGLQEERFPNWISRPNSDRASGQKNPVALTKPPLQAPDPWEADPGIHR